MTMIAVGVLVLDGALLTVAGLWSDRLGLILSGVALIGLAGAVILLWRRQVRVLAEINKARAEIRDEAVALRELLKERKGLRTED
jgi:hypothetical protein